VAAVTGRTADEWSSPSPPKDAEVSIPKAVPCTRLANLILPPKQQEAQHLEAHIPRWGIWVAAHLFESKAWAMYRDREKWFAPLVGGRTPVVLWAWQSATSLPSATTVAHRLTACVGSSLLPTSLAT
jgi:hypothetical protein